jgi:hypothetical protein
MAKVIIAILQSFIPNMLTNVTKLGNAVMEGTQLPQPVLAVISLNTPSRDSAVGIATGYRLDD